MSVLTVNFYINHSKIPCPDDLAHFLTESSKEYDCPLGPEKKNMA